MPFDNLFRSDLYRAQFVQRQNAAEGAMGPALLQGMQQGQNLVLGAQESMMRNQQMAQGAEQHEQDIAAGEIEMATLGFKQQEAMRRVEMAQRISEVRTVEAMRVRADLENEMLKQEIDLTAERARGTKKSNDSPNLLKYSKGLEGKIPVKGEAADAQGHRSYLVPRSTGGGVGMVPPDEDERKRQKGEHTRKLATRDREDRAAQYKELMDQAKAIDYEADQVEDKIYRINQSAPNTNPFGDARDRRWSPDTEGGKEVARLSIKVKQLRAESARFAAQAAIVSRGERPEGRNGDQIRTPQQRQGLDARIPVKGNEPGPSPEPNVLGSGEAPTPVVPTPAKMVERRWTHSYGIRTKSSSWFMQGEMKISKEDVAKVQAVISADNAGNRLLENLTGDYGHRLVLEFINKTWSTAYSMQHSLLADGRIKAQDAVRDTGIQAFTIGLMREMKKNPKGFSRALYDFAINNGSRR